MIFKTLKTQTEAQINDLLKEWNSAAIFIFYNNILGHYRQFINVVRAPKNDDKAIANSKNVFLNSVQKIINETDIGKLFVSINTLLEHLREEKSNSLLLKDGIENTIVKMNEIWTTLNDLSRNPRNYNLIVKLIEQFEETEITFQYFQNSRSFLKATERIIGGESEKNEFESAIELEFSIKIETLENLLIRLNSIGVIYSEACLLFGVTESDFPLKISKIETGSLWGKFFGNSKVMDFISWFLKNGIKYLHRSFTTEGKLNQIPTDLKILEKEFELHLKLKESLSDKRYEDLIGKNEETLVKSVVLLSKHTQKLIEKETKLKIDDEQIELSAPYSEKYLLEAKKQLPESS